MLAPTSKSLASRWRLSLGPRARKSEQRSARVSRPTFSRIWWQTQHTWRPKETDNEPRLLEFMLVCDQEGLRSKGPILRAMFVNSAVSLVAEDVDVELVGDVQDQLHQLVVALKDLQLRLPRAWKCWFMVSFWHFPRWQQWIPSNMNAVSQVLNIFLTFCTRYRKVESALTSRISSCHV